MYAASTEALESSTDGWMCIQKQAEVQEKVWQNEVGGELVWTNEEVSVAVKSATLPRDRMIRMLCIGYGVFLIEIILTLLFVMLKVGV